MEHILNWLVALAGYPQASSGGVVSAWAIASVIITVILALIGAICWFLKQQFGSLKETDNRVEGKIDKNFTYLIKETKSIDRRVARIEGHLDLGSLTISSPINLTKIGEEILLKSGVKEAAEKYQDALMKEIKAENPTNAYDVQEAVRHLFQVFDFGPDFTTRFKDYSFQSGRWGLSDILDVGAIYFRDVALKELGLKYNDLNNKSQMK